MISPSAHMRKERVTLKKRTWGKDIDGGRVITSTQTVTGVPCSVQPGPKSTSVDETGRWTSESSYELHFSSDPDLRSHDEVLWVEDTSLSTHHNLVVVGVINAAGRGVSFVVSCVERT